MRILGQGIDVVEFTSLNRLLSQAEGDFIAEFFTDDEIAHFPEGVHRLEHLAGQFAAKEAVTKALGTGFTDGVAFGDVEVSRSEDGVPCVRLLGGAAARAAQLGVDAWFLSISHGDTLAIASAIAVAVTDSFA